MKKINKISLFFTAILLCNIVQGMKRNLNHLLVVVEKAHIEETNVYTPQMLSLLKEMDKLQKRAKSNEVNTTKGLYQCGEYECRFRTTHESHFINHQSLHKLMQKIPGITMYRCEDCHYLTQRNKGFKEHQISHNPEKKYICPVEGCGKAIKHPRSFARHMNQQHPHINVLT